ncbi:MAG: hypothetical protein Barrevirus42_4, partial [Barrevirus sp.]
IDLKEKSVIKGDSYFTDHCRWLYDMSMLEKIILLRMMMILIQLLIEIRRINF